MPAPLSLLAPWISWSWFDVRGRAQYHITPSLLHRALDFVVAIGRQTARRQTDLIPAHIIISKEK